jgi:hypothetical protein
MFALQRSLLVFLLYLTCTVTQARELLVMPPLNDFGVKADITLNGRVVGALEKAVAEMRRYKLLSRVGRQMDSYEISITFDKEGKVATFLFLPKIDQNVDLRARGAFTIEVDVRLSDLKTIERRIFN